MKTNESPLKKKKNISTCSSLNNLKKPISFSNIDNIEERDDFPTE